MHKYLETPIHGFFSFIDLFRRRYDVVLLCNAANAPFAWIVRLFGIPLAINVDGVERRRAKWNIAGRVWYRVGEYCSVLFASRIVADAKVIADYYLERYKCPSTTIGYGAAAQKLEAGAILKKFGLLPRKYLLYVSRLEPENNALGVIQAYSRLKTDLPLCVVGDAPYAGEYIAELKRAAGKNVIFTGYQFGEAYHELQSNCYLYIQASEVGGTHPALVESMAHGNCIVANDVPEHREVLEGAGSYYHFNDFSDLSTVLSNLIAEPARVESFGTAAIGLARKKYSWEAIVDQYEALLTTLAAKRAAKEAQGQSVHE